MLPRAADVEYYLPAAVGLLVPDRRVAAVRAVERVRAERVADVAARAARDRRPVQLALLERLRDRRADRVAFEARAAPHRTAVGEVRHPAVGAARGGIGVERAVGRRELRRRGER